MYGTNDITVKKDWYTVANSADSAQCAKWPSVHTLTSTRPLHVRQYTRPSRSIGESLLVLTPIQRQVKCLLLHITTQMQGQLAGTGERVMEWRQIYVALRHRRRYFTSTVFTDISSIICS